MQDDFDDIDTLLTPRLTGRETAETHAALTAWAGGHADRLGLLAHTEQLATHWRAPRRPDAEERDAWHRLERVMECQVIPAAPHRVRPKTWWLSGAACAAALVLAAAGLARHRAHADVASTAMPALTGPRYTTTTGQRATITLADGSRLTLAPRTTVQLAADFGAHTRTLMLNGEAFFEVAASSGAPFVVRTGTVSTRVLGTAFNVRRYAEDRYARISVVTGKVHVGGTSSTSRIDDRAATITLAAGMVGDMTDSAGGRIVPGDAEQEAAWRNGRLVLRDARASEVLATLSRWYGYEFRYTDSTLARKTLTVGLSTESSSAALATLKLALDVELVFDGNVVTLRPRTHSRSAVPTRGPLPHSTAEVGR